MGEVEMAVWLCDAENDAVVGLVTSPFIQRHEVMCSPSPLIPPFVFKNHVQVLAALGTTAMLPDICRALSVIVESNALAIGVRRAVVQSIRLSL